MCSTCCNRSGTGTAITYICYMYIYTYASLFSPTHMFSSTRNTTDRSTCLAIASVTDDGWTGTRECVRSGIVEVLVVIERRRSAPTPMLGRQFGVEIWSGPDAFFGLLQDVAGTLRGVSRTASARYFDCRLRRYLWPFQYLRCSKTVPFCSQRVGATGEPLSVSLTASGDAPRSRTSMSASPRGPGTSGLGMTPLERTSHSYPTED